MKKDYYFIDVVADADHVSKSNSWRCCCRWWCRWCWWWYDAVGVGDGAAPTADDDETITIHKKFIIKIMFLFLFILFNCSKKLVCSFLYNNFLTEGSN